MSDVEYIYSRLQQATINWGTNGSIRIHFIFYVYRGIPLGLAILLYPMAMEKINRPYFPIC